MKQGRQVSFFRAPCQVAGIRSDLGKDYEGLVWRKYWSGLAIIKTLETVSFKDKTYGWKRYSLRFTYNNDDE